MSDGTAALIDALRRRGGKVREVRPGHWKAQCPAHNDTNPSLSIDKSADGKPLIRCFAECETESVLNALGLKWPDILGDHRNSNGGAHPAPQTGGGLTLRFADLDAAGKAILAQLSGATPAGQWVYHAADGTPVLAQMRFDLPEHDPVTGKVKKTFRIMRKIENGWGWGKPSGLLSLYRLPELLASPGETVFVVEGEKTADAAAGIGLLTVTSACGAGQGRLTDWSPLANRKVVILPDNDKSGAAHAVDVARRLAGIGCEIRVVTLPGLPEKGDIVEWLSADGQAGGLDAEEARTRLQALVNDAPLWTPDGAQTHRAQAATSPVLRRLSDVKPEPVRWLWPSRIALGKLTVIAGDPGLGKSFLTLDMAARVSTGTGWPDAPEIRTTPGGVVLLSAEDDPADTIRPRLDAAHADVSRIVLLEAIRDSESGAMKTRAFNLAEDLDALESAISAAEGCRLVIVDPISAYLGNTDSHKNAEVRAVLAPLAELARRRGVAVLAVTHLRKSESAAIYRAMGSLAFVAAARAVFAVARDPQDETGKRRFFLPVKCNLSSDRNGFAYSLLADAGDTPHVAWESDPVTVDVDELLGAEAKRKGPAPEGRDAAAEWLKEELSQGPRPSQELFNEAKKEGHSARTLKRAKEILRIRARKTRFDGQWTWGLPEEGHEEGQVDPDPGPLGLLGTLGPLGENTNT